MIPHGPAGDSPCYQSAIKSRAEREAAEDKAGGVFVVLTHGRDLTLMHRDSPAPPGQELRARHRHREDEQSTKSISEGPNPHPTNEEKAAFVHLCVQTGTRH